MEQVVRQTLHELRKLMKLLRQDLKQLLEVVDLMLHVLQLIELLRHDLKQLLEHLLRRRLNVMLRLRTKWVPSERVPAKRRSCREGLSDVARRGPDTVCAPRHSDSSMMFFLDAGTP